MKKVCIFLTILIVTVLKNNAQPFHISFTKYYGGSKNEIFYNFFETADKGLLIYGNTRSIDGDFSGFKTVKGPMGNKFPENFLIKVDSSGNIEWKKQILMPTALGASGLLSIIYKYKNKCTIYNNGYLDTRRYYHQLIIDSCGAPVFKLTYPYSYSYNSIEGDVICIDKGLIYRINLDGDTIWRTSINKYFEFEVELHLHNFKIVNDTSYLLIMSSSKTVENIGEAYIGGKLFLIDKDGKIINLQTIPGKIIQTLTSSNRYIYCSRFVGEMGSQKIDTTNFFTKIDLTTLNKYDNIINSPYSIFKEGLMTNFEFRYEQFKDGSFASFKFDDNRFILDMYNESGDSIWNITLENLNRIPIIELINNRYLIVYPFLNSLKIISIDKNGIVKWRNELKGSLSIDKKFWVLVGTNDSFYITCNTKSNDGSFSGKLNTYNDWIFKFDNNNGNILWKDSYDKVETAWAIGGSLKQYVSKDGHYLQIGVKKMPNRGYDIQFTKFKP